MIHTDYIVEILGHFEGKAIPKGYVPCKDGVPLGASGVTIGTGFDLGQQSEKDLHNLALPKLLYEKLVPYLGKKKMAALVFLKDHPLELTSEEVKTLDFAVHEKYIMETERLFGDNIADVPKQVQAVAVSLHYQFGTPRRIASPALELAWESMQRGLYGQAADYLMMPQGWSANHRQYMVRRKQEAALLREVA
jgi:hypothetical protein